MENCTDEISLTQKEEFCVCDEIARIFKTTRECIKIVDLMMKELSGITPPVDSEPPTPTCMKNHIRTARIASRALEDRLQDLMHLLLG